MSRQDQRSVSVTIDGENTGVWDTKSGANAVGNSTKYREGGGGGEVNLGGRKSRENMTASRLFKLSRDLPRIKAWDAKVGKAEVVVTELFLDRDDNVVGQGITYRGTLEGLTPPEADSESTDAAKVEIELMLEPEIA